MSALQAGSELGGRATTAATNAGSMLMQGGLGAAQANLASGVGWMNTMKDFGLGMMKYK